MQSLDKIYEQRHQKFEEDKESLHQKMRLTGNIRVFLFIGMCFCLLQLFSSNFEQLSYWWMFLACIPVFAMLVKVHQQQFERKELAAQLSQINNKEAVAQQSGQAQFDGGAEFKDATHAYAADIDLFGHNSLFAYINRCVTANGRLALAQLFKQQLPSVETIRQQQQSVAFLAPMIDFRQQFMARGSLTQDSTEDTNLIQSWATTETIFLTQWYWQLIRIVMPLAGMAALIYFMFTFNYQFLLLIAFINFCILGIKSKYLNQQHGLMAKRQSVLKMYTALLQTVTQQDFAADEQLNKVAQTAQDAQQSMQQLSNIIRFFDQRLNVFIGLGLNLIILYDIHCIFALEKWKKQHNKQLPHWIKAVAQLEVLISLSTYHYNNPTFTFPHLEKSDKVYIKAKQLGHPLIKATERVDSDTLLDEHSVYIVTGSNMAGKSTFLRTVAINLLLAQCGATVCSSDFSCSLMQILTSMRVQDSIDEQTSYFQAELLRLKYIIDILEARKPSFVILDEILKGTNSDDKLLGSQLLVKRFLNYPSMVMIATHDLELGKMADVYPLQIQNLCFESQIKEDQLLFDYTLQKGIAKNKNATFLMRQMQIIKA